MKLYKNLNVYEAANKRLEFIFNNFEKIYLSFSGGKDSSCMLNLTLDYMKKHKIQKKIGVLFVDLEGQYKLTIDHIQRMLVNNRDYIIPFWCCLPLNLRNAVSVFQPFWTCWDEENRDKWIREYPDFECITEHNHPFDFFKKHMEFEQFVPEFARWFAQGKKTACLVGIRSDESLNRFRTIINEAKETCNNQRWTTRVIDNVYNCYPIYDWTTEDDWIANGKFGWEYNHLYDLMYKAGVPLSKQRICQPYGDDQRAGLNLFRIIEPETWAKVVNRVSGANFGNIYCGDKILGYRKVKLPKGHTWKSYTKLLLKTLPIEMQNHYKTKFIKFMQYWHKTGCPVQDEDKDKLPPQAKLTGEISTRGSKNKETIRYSSIPDKLEGKWESKKMAPTWRRMAICILKNDQLCKTLSFSQTKEQHERMKVLLEKYKNL